jgi:formylglycine-generating enzyme required for sulfatase activity
VPRQREVLLSAGIDGNKTACKLIVMLRGVPSRWRRASATVSGEDLGPEEIRPMFRQTYTATLLALAALGSLNFAISSRCQAASSEKEITNSIGMKLIYCPSGSFRMGSLAGEKDRSMKEEQVSVTISKGFYLGKYTVTQVEFKAVMGTTPWAGKAGDDYPATDVDWKNAAEFCRKLTARESQAGRLPQGYVYALPTEAQREYACRAGTTTAYSFGDDAGNLGDYAWWGGFSAGGNAKTEQYAHRVGQKKPNPWGLYDMHGNVWEWCRDFYAEKLPGGTDPLVETGFYRVIRGGSWINSAAGCRSANRSRAEPWEGISTLGFRASLVPAGK